MAIGVGNENGVAQAWRGRQCLGGGFGVAGGSRRRGEGGAWLA